MIHKSAVSPLMKFLRTITGRILLIALSIVIAEVLRGFAMDRYWEAHPQKAFLPITRRGLPEGVHATKFRRTTDDNYRQTPNYWLLTGSPPALRQVTNNTGLVESEDARTMIPDLHDLFGDSDISTEIVTGYEWELDHDRWYWIFKGETTALYMH